MHAQRPAEQTADRSVSQILQNLKKREQESDEIELDFFQKQQIWAERHIRRLMAKIRQRDTGDLQQVPQMPNQTPGAFQVPPEELKEELERVSQSLNQPRQKKAHNDGTPTQQLGNPGDVALMQTVIMPSPIRVPERVETIYIIDDLTFDTIIASLGNAIYEHEQTKKLSATSIHMSSFIVGLLEIRQGITDYPTGQTTIPLIGDITIPNDTIKVITQI